MNKYILMLGVAAVALASYCAYANNSATMNVTATIAHDVSLNVTQDIELGTITIDPSRNTGTILYYKSIKGITKLDGVIAVNGYTAGRFTANIANPTACNGARNPCGGLTITYDGGLTGFSWNPVIVYQYTTNDFRVYDALSYTSAPAEGDYEGEIRISYTAP